MSYSGARRALPHNYTKSSNPPSRKYLDVRPCDRTTVQGATFNMHGNCTVGTPVVSALGSESDDPGSRPGRARCCAFETCGKKKTTSSAFRLG